jgi:TonB family protein
MEIKKSKPLPLKTKQIWTAICVVVLLISFYCQIFVFPWGNNRLVAMLALLAIISILGIWTKTEGATKAQKFTNVILFIVLIVGEIFLAMYLRDLYIENQVNKYGVVTNGEVVDVLKKPSGRSSRKVAMVAYSVNGSTRYNEVSNSNKRMEKWDRVKLMYSSKDPDIFSITKIIKSEDEPVSSPVKQAVAKGVSNSARPATFIDTPPEFVGGMPALYAYLRDNVVYPQQAREQRITGKVLVSFVINHDGSVTDARIEQGIGGGCDEAALQAVNDMPNWKPGVQNGKPVRVKYNIPISFSL